MNKPLLSIPMSGNDNKNDNYTNSNGDAFDLSKFSTEEKLSWLGGYDLWNLRAIPGLTEAAPTITQSTRSTSFRSSMKSTRLKPVSLCLSDGPHGLRKPLSDFSLQQAHPATCFPSACSTACSWNPELLATMGRALSLECERYDVNVLLGPGINLKRHPCGGRNHEYYSEDPYLTGVLAQSYIGGVQESGNIGACIKHFCANNQEANRFVVDVKVDERTLRELYLPAFERSLNQNKNNENSGSVPKLVMAAYNKVNGMYSCEHNYLLQSVLRGEWKYDGVVVSDWGAIHDRSASLRAGMDLEMPGTPSKGAFDEEVLEECTTLSTDSRRQDDEDDEEQLIGNVTKNELETAIDDCANRVVRLIADLQGGNRGNKSEGATSEDLFAKHNQLAREIGRECIVLLQNKDNFLPLSKDECFRDGTPRIGLVGAFGKGSPRYQGMGSAHVTPTKLTSVYDALQSSFGNDGPSDSTVSTPFAKGYDADTDGDEIDQSMIDEAVLMAKQPGLDVLVVCVGLPEIAESEGFDRTRTGLPKQHVSIVEALTKVHSNVVVVLSHGGIVEIPESFVAGTKAILDGYLLGQACGPAILDVLFGVVSPSGRLPETIPIQPDDSTPAANYFPGTQHTVEYREGLDVGYRYYDTVKLPVRFPFGHGLHYTNFEYKNLETAIEQDAEASKRVRVSLDIRNAGNKGAPAFSKPVKEVVQLYIHPLGSSVYRPAQELKGFQKIEIAPGETKRVEFVLDERSFAFYDIGWKDWIVEGGNGFEVRIGASSRDIRLATTLNFSTGREASKVARESYPPITETNKTATGTRLVVDEETFLKRFEGQIPPTASSTRSASLTTDGSEVVSSSLAIDSHASQLPSESPAGEEGIITRNTLIVDAARASRIGSILMFFSWMVAKQEVKEGPSKNRELRMIRANLENVPLRTLVVFSQGAMTFRTLDVLIHFMNGKPGKAMKRLFRRKSKRRNSSIRMQN